MQRLLPAHLETERIVLEPQEVKQQPEGWRKLGEEVTEEWTGNRPNLSSDCIFGPSNANAERIVMAPLPAG